MSRRGPATLVVCAGMALAAPAGAVADTVLGTSGGVTYVQDTVMTGAAPTSATVDAECPLGMRVTAGGSLISGTTVEGRINSSTMSDGGDADSRADDAWVSVLHNSSGGAKSASTWALCTGERVRYRQAEAVVRPGVGKRIKLGCPAGTDVSGGGATVSGNPDEAWLNTAAPFDGADGNPITDDGWKLRVGNSGGGRKDFIARAACVETNLRYRIGNTSATDNVFSFCFGSEVAIGGGISLTGPAVENYANAFHPFTELVDPPDMGYTARFANLSGPPSTLTAHSVCLR